MLANLFSPVNGTFHKIVCPQRTFAHCFVGIFTKTSLFPPRAAVPVRFCGKYSQRRGELCPPLPILCGAGRDVPLFPPPGPGSAAVRLPRTAPTAPDTAAAPSASIPSRSGSGAFSSVSPASAAALPPRPKAWVHQRTAAAAASRPAARKKNCIVYPSRYFFKNIL